MRHDQISKTRMPKIRQLPTITASSHSCAVDSSLGTIIDRFSHLAEINVGIGRMIHV
ncbi:hypothetical protein [Rhizobium sp. YK2]|uniref:hypothetical protein n=1 Tax=Rhizobium sp. YK2 TaxID=1860096 RepID=UPI00159F09EA|nr:hypothetical protein [Rhizobium sp. YK2]